MPLHKAGSRQHFIFAQVAVFFVAASFLAAQVGCSSSNGGGSPSAPTVTVTSSASTVLLGNQVQFTAQVTGTTNTAVTWSVNGVAGGNSTVGTISASGVYTAPGDLPNPAKISVSATSQADTSTSGSASITVTSDVIVTVATNPAQTSKVATGSAISLIAAIASNGKPDLNVSWSVNGVPGGNGSIGTISAAGADSATYQAPATVPTPFTVTIAATSKADSSRSASLPMIVAGTIASVTQTISAAAGGTITLPDGSSITIAAGVLPSDESVTLSEVSYLPNQPPNPAVAFVGPGLVLTFENPVELALSAKGTAKQARAAEANPQSNANVSTAFHFVINTANNSIAGLVGSVPVADFIDSLNNNFFFGTAGQYVSEVQTVTADIGSDILSGATTAVKFIAVSAANIVKIAFHLFTAPNRLTLSGNTWTNYSACPSGKTLLVVHGMLSYVEKAFSATDQTIQNIKQSGLYDNIVGFDYDWTQAIDASGGQLANFLNMLSQCSQIGDLDIEAHSEGVPVSMSALAQSAAHVKHFVSLGGPIMGTPVANDARLLDAIIIGASELDLGDNVVLDTLSELLGKPFVKDLQVSPADSGDKLDSIRKALSSASVGDAPQLVLVGGNSPQEWYLKGTAAIMHTTYGVTSSDGFIPLASALAFQSDLNGIPHGLKVYPLFPYPTGHVDLESDLSIQKDVGNQVSNGFLPPSLTISSFLGPCWSGLICNGPPGAQFTINGSSYAAAANVQEYGLYADGTVVPLSILSAVNQTITLQDTPNCSTAPRTVVYFTQDEQTKLYSNAVTEQVVQGNCGSSNPVPSISLLSPASLPVGSPSSTITITGTGFLPSTQALFNGVLHTPTIQSSAQLSILLSSTDLSVSGVFPVELTNPAPGGGSSNVAVFTVSTGGAGSVTISPTSVSLPEGGVQTFTASVVGSSDGVIWSVQEGAAGGAIVSSTSSSAVYSPPNNTGTFHVVAINADSSSQTAVATVTVVASAPLVVLHSFAGGVADGSDPAAALIQATDGNFYGTTEQGGASNFGTVFRMNSSGGVTLLHSFAVSDGDVPSAALVQAADGNFYGTTEGGGPEFGAVFRTDGSGNLTVLHSFTFYDGSDPVAPVIQASDGNFYGTTRTAATGFGTVFKMDSSGSLTVLHSFAGSDGSTPLAALVQASDGSFYGTTEGGGPASCGTIFKMDSAGNVTTLHSFSGADGCSPVAALIQAIDGNLYGTTQGGGASNIGTVFRMDSAGNVTVLHSFTGPDGNTPVAPLIQASDGNFYGTTQVGGNPGVGTVFKMDAVGNVTVLHSFTGPPDGRAPEAALLQGVDGNLYGTTIFGGSDDIGVVFRIDPAAFSSAAASKANDRRSH